jgi:hypothetical protein
MNYTPLADTDVRERSPPPVAKRRGHCQKRGVGATSEIAQKPRNLRDILRAKPFDALAQNESD